MMIVDAQVHIWGADTPERPWPKTGHSYAHRETPLDKDTLLREMDAAGVDRVVIVPPSWEGDRNDLALEAARLHPDRFAIMGRLPLHPANPDAAASWRQQPGMLGLRFTAGRESAWLTDGSAEWVWQAAQRNGLPVMISCPGLLPVIDGIAERYPGLRIVIDHLALVRDAKFDLSELAIVTFLQAKAYGKSGDLRAWADFAHVLFNVKEFVAVP